MENINKHHWLEIVVTLIVCLVFIFLCIIILRLSTNITELNTENTILHRINENLEREKNDWEIERAKTFESIGMVLNILSDMNNKTYKNIEEIIIDLRVNQLKEQYLAKKIKER